jgi:uncharacterized protein (TIGR03067 family)
MLFLGLSLPPGLPRTPPPGNLDLPSRIAKGYPMKISLIPMVLAIFAWSDPDQAQIDKRKLQGTWKVIAAEAAGEVAPAKEIEDMEIIFTGDNIKVREGGKVKERFTFKIDPDKTPPAIDFTFTEGKKKGRTDRGIYRLDGNNLKICIQEDAAGPRPAEFTTREGTKLSLVVLRRFD